MKITIICSITFYNEVKDLRDRLVEKGHEVITPYSIERILDGKITIEEVNEKKQQYGEERNQEKHELITNYMNKVREAGAVLVANYDKNGIANYIGGNTLMEMAFALAYDKKIYLLNPIPDMGYTDEIAGCLPVVLDGDLCKIV